MDAPLCRECGFPRDHQRHEQRFVGSWMLAHPFSAPDAAPVSEVDALRARLEVLERELAELRQVAEERAGRIVELTLELRKLRETLGDDHGRKGKTARAARKDRDD